MLLRVALISIFMFCAMNTVLYVYYSQRMYPQTKVMNANIGNLPYDQVESKIRQMELLPETVQLVYDGRSAEVTLPDLGISPDYSKLVPEARKTPSWLPAMNLLTSRTLDPPISVDRERLRLQAEVLKPAFRKAPVNAHLSLDHSEFTVREAEQGYELEVGQLQEMIVREIKAGQSIIKVPVEIVIPSPPSIDLEESRRALQSQLSTPIAYRYNGLSVKASAQEISNWYLPAEETYAVSEPRIRSYILKLSDDLGIRPQDLGHIVSNTKKALESQTGLESELVPFTRTRTFRYCVAAKNVESSHLAGLANSADLAYNDPHGWSLDGQIAFKMVDRNCDYTMWLSAADQMESFHPSCDPEWSCRVGDNVIINFERWQSASPAWISHGGSLNDYRSMVINHETGHRLGFGHNDCGGPGQQAPVMQQQSIDLQGCAFNPWPTSGEREILRQLLGL